MDDPSDSASKKKTRPVWRRWLAGLLLVLMIAVLGFYGWVTWYVNSSGFKAQLEERLSDILEVEVSIGSFLFVPWSTLIAQNITVPTGDKSFPKPVLDVDRVEVDLDLFSCLQGKWIIRSVDIKSPTALLQENDKGNVAVKFTPKEEVEDENAVKIAQEEAVGQLVDFAVDQATIRTGELTYIDQKKHQTLHMQDIELSANVGAQQGLLLADGSVGVNTITLVEKLELTQMRSPIKVSESEMDLEAVTAKIYQGALSGNASAQLAKSGVPYKVSLKIKDLDMATLLKAFGSGDDMTMGKLQLTFNGGGQLEKASEIAGTGMVDVGPFHSKGVPVLGTLAKLVGVPALADIRFDKIKMKYKVENQTGIIDAMQTYPLDADVVVIGAGKVGFDGKITFQGEATIDSGLAKVVNDVVKTLLLKSSEGLLTVPFTITGTADNPSVHISPEGFGESVIKGLLDFIPIVPTNKIFESSLRKHVEEVFGEEGKSPTDLRKAKQDAEDKKKKDEEPPGANKGGVQGPRESTSGTKTR